MFRWHRNIRARLTGRWPPRARAGPPDLAARGLGPTDTSGPPRFRSPTGPPASGGGHPGFRATPPEVMVDPCPHECRSPPRRCGPAPSATAPSNSPAALGAAPRSHRRMAGRCGGSTTTSTTCVASATMWPVGSCSPVGTRCRGCRGRRSTWDPVRRRPPLPARPSPDHDRSGRARRLQRLRRLQRFRWFRWFRRVRSGRVGRQAEPLRSHPRDSHPAHRHQCRGHGRPGARRRCWSPPAR